MSLDITKYWATRTRRTILMIITALSAFFAALLAATFYLRWAAEVWPTPFHFASLLMASAVTMFALCGSVTAEVSAHSVQFDDQEPAVRWLAVAVSSWLLFLFLELVEWVRLVYLEKLGWDTTFGATFLTLTGVHWILAVLLVCWMTWAANNTRTRDVTAVTLFSHFLSAVWLVLLFCLYFTNVTFDGI